MPFRLQQGSNQVYADKKQGMEGYDQDRETQPAVCLVYDEKAVLAKGVVRPVRDFGIVQSTLGMPHEHVLQDSLR